jgi:hypothetical protein
MVAKLLQPSFGGGEYAEELLGRVDLARYGISGKTVRNFIVRTSGGLDVRPGTDFIGEVKDSAKATRLLPFIVSETLAYAIELSPGFMRFIFDGGYLESGGVPVEAASPWLESELFEVHVTQSADTMVLVHPNHAPRLLRRTGASTFTLGTFTPREGPFRSLNGNQALVLASSAATGTVTITANFDLFEASMVGGLIYLEPQALGNIKPWTQGERSPGLVVHAQRRSDGKVYRAANVTVPSGGASPGLNYCETGNVRPTHESGIEWDGPGTQKEFDTVLYNTGVAWEYLHSGYGIAEIVSFFDPRTVTAVVRKTLPPEVVGGVGTPSGAWAHSGDGATVTFALPGATSSSTSNYRVSIDGSPTQSDPNYTPPSDGGSGGTGDWKGSDTDSPTYEPV